MRVTRRALLDAAKRGDIAVLCAFFSQPETMRAAEATESRVADALAALPPRDRRRAHYRVSIDDPDAWFQNPDTGNSLADELYDETGHLAVIEWLLSAAQLQTALPETTRFLLSSALLSAATMREIEVVETILSSAFFRNRIIVATPEIYNQLLKAATMSGAMIRLVVSHGVDINAPIEPDGWARTSSAVGLASLLCVNTVEDMVKEGASTLLSEPLDVSLIERCEPGDLTTLHRLGFDLNQVGRDLEHGLLHELMMESNRTLTEELLRIGTIDIDIRDANERTPLMVAARGAQWEYEDDYVQKSSDTRAVANVKLLLESGADVNAQDEDGNTVLHIAAQLGLHETTQWLLRSGADPSITNHVGDTYVDVPSL
ncbi:hypothetical protein P43SY_003675 [Pythium insidiosum]|uniref:Ankyrin repeat protein n=1 Tax=Pythium insidiosum TaxID=114742 RepID=A0AAD5LU82_PYTIN|nr:hypothetical protein P43SY_003675 [Pythium insidiosum]